MKRPSFSRTRPWPDIDRTKGSVTMTVLLLLAVFTGLGLAMLHASAVHVKINGFRRFSALLDCASENGLKRGLADLASWIETEGLLAPVGDAGLEAVRAGAPGAFPALIEEAFGTAFPRAVEETFDGLSWTSRAECGLLGFEDRGGYLRLTAGLRIEASGGLARVRSRRTSVLEGSLGLLAGRLPLAAISLYIEGALTDGERAAFPGENGIELPARPGQPVGAALAASAGGVLPGDPGPLAAKALSIGLFRPGDLSPARLREALGLEASAEPVPDGVYLVHDDIGLGGIYVRGDLDEMVLAIRDEAQVVVFRAGGAEWRLEWSPSRCRTEFAGPDGTAVFDLLPVPIVLVDGAIAALGGGAAGADGRVEMSFEGETPAVLDGVDLTIVSADRVTIASHLIREGVRWQDGIPYAKDSEAQLVIYAAGRDIATGDPAAGGIAIAAGAPDDLKVQASLTAAAGGFRIEGRGRTVELLGGLQADAYAGNGNRLLLYGDDRAAGGEWPANSPLTAQPQLAFFALKVLAWREY